MKKFLTSLLVLVMLAVAIPAFAAIREFTCSRCHGSGKCPICFGTGKVAALHWERNEKGKKVRVPPYWKKCYGCLGNKKCRPCQGKGKIKRYTDY